MKVEKSEKNNLPPEICLLFRRRTTLAPLRISCSIFEQADMSLAQWRQFNFFDKHQALDPEDKNKSPAVFDVRLAFCTLITIAVPDV